MTGFSFGTMVCLGFNFKVVQLYGAKRLLMKSLLQVNKYAHIAALKNSCM